MLPFIQSLSFLIICFAFIPAAQAAQPATSLVSVDANGVQIYEGSTDPAISGDGRYVVFSSSKDDGIFVHDRQTGKSALVSVDSGGVQGNGLSKSPAISGDGRYVAFQSYAYNLVSGDTNGTTSDIFVHDRQTGQTALVSVSSGGAQGNKPSTAPAISGDGRYVAFYSEANLVTEDDNNSSDIFVRDLQTGQTARVSVDSSGGQAIGWSYNPAISEDGRYVAFESTADLVSGPDTNGTTRDIFIRDLQANPNPTTTLVSVDSGDVQADGPSYSPAISGDGRYVAFVSEAENLVSGDTNGTTSDIFVHDRQTGQTALVSVSSGGAQGNKPSTSPAISGDGRYVAFKSDADNLVSDDDNGKSDIFVHDRQTGRTTRVSVDSSGGQANGWSYNPAISGDGRYVAFDSYASNLVSGDTNGNYDIFIRGPLGIPVIGGPLLLLLSQ